MSDDRVHLGDCLGPEGLATLPNDSVSHIICDPPYEAEAHTKARRAVTGSDHDTARSGSVADYEIDFAPITDSDRRRVAVEMVRVSRGWVLAFCQVEAVTAWRQALVRAGASWRRAMAWVKPDGAPQFTGDRPAQGFECIVAVWAGAGRSRWNGGGARGVYVYGVNDFGRIDRPHPTSKPLDLMSALVSDFTDPGDLVCDPFAGSGTTGVACKRLGRRFVGWERDPKYHAIAQKRIDGTREQLGMFRERVPEPKQATLIEVPRSARASGEGGK